MSVSVRRITALLLLDRQVVGAVALCLLYSAAVVQLHFVGGCPAWLSTGANKISSSLASILGLLLAFRSNASAGRWDASRKAWTDIHANCRCVIRLLSTAPLIKGGSGDRKACLTQQREVLRLLAAFALLVALQLFGVTIIWPTTTHGDGGHVKSVELSVLYSLLPSRYFEAQANGNGVQKETGLSSNEPLDELRSGLRRRRLPVRSRTDHGTSGDAQNYSEKAREERLLHDDDDEEFLAALLPRPRSENFALFLLTDLQKCLDEMYQAGVSNDAHEDGEPQISLPAPIYAHCTNALNTLIARLTELEAIRDTTTPPMLRIHLSHVLVINQLLLPISLAPALGWWTPVAASLVAYSFVALYHLAESLAQPFRRGDLNALPLRRWAAEVVREAKEAEIGLSS
ncbi:unnamed protein product [Tilletia controversa]|uniref:Uncharacterized protein n=3 Tax=Tilletia TaxID=13289 RepID=A0A8X7SX51_9BASI|nr:hypothetical protein CF336_g3064 [Tilletia laevis]KAE8206051.1 hypothetical protein CF328_g131 [Tilletia controversa]KAE8262218.1 hypothetical protein A4X03_0g2626 [Tilletia caries]KAE8205080.1 hypothetical protein CF335_g2426 [Tilletia laevis]KAE8248415.1 hypothetical protein A4X06_0g3733 [Tilletia controversa]